MLLSQLKDGLSHLIFPQLCAGCTRPLIRDESTLCLNCNLALPRTAFHNVAENEAVIRFAGRLPFQHATSFCYFTADGLLQHLLHRLKYGRTKSIGRYLGQQFGHELKDMQWLASVDAVIPVPLHTKKEKQRGYNQSAEIASGLTEVLNKPLIKNAISRIRYTQSQTGKSREERLTNVTDAFVVNNEDIVAGMHLLLIDDVLTTGATLEACALALLKARGVTVSFATIGLATI